MEQYRVTQILQELINDKNSELSQLNGYLLESQASNWNYVNPQDYQNIVNEKDAAWSRVNDLQNQLASIQQNYDILSSNSNNSSAELDAMRSVIEAVRSERDFFASEISRKDAELSALNASYADLKDVELAKLQSQINDLNAAASDSNNIITNLTKALDDKKTEIDDLVSNVSELQLKLDTLKKRVKEELSEAAAEIDEVFS
jgi:chromosome segregation ATPase